jgi:hypothetical protein
MVTLTAIAAILLFSTPVLAQTDVTQLLQGQPVTIAALIAMVMIVWILSPLVKMAFQFALQMVPAVQKLSDSATKLAEEVERIQGELKTVQQNNEAHFAVIASERKVQLDRVSKVEGELNGLHAKVDAIMAYLRRGEAAHTASNQGA